MTFAEQYQVRHKGLNSPCMHLPCCLHKSCQPLAAGLRALPVVCMQVGLGLARSAAEEAALLLQPAEVHQQLQNLQLAPRMAAVCCVCQLAGIAGLKAQPAGEQSATSDDQAAAGSTCMNSLRCDGVDG